MSTETTELKEIESLKSEAARLEAIVAEKRAQQEEIQARLWSRRTERQAEWARQLVEAYDHARALDRQAEDDERARRIYFESESGSALVETLAGKLLHYFLWMHVSAMAEEGDTPLHCVAFPDLDMPGILGTWISEEARARADERLGDLMAQPERYVAGHKVPAPLSG